MSELLTAAEAAEILGMTESGVYKLIARGEVPRRANGRRDPNARGILDRAEVEELAAQRAREAAELAQWRAARREAPTNPREPGKRLAPPDREHEWVGSKEAAEVIDITTQAFAKRCRKGTIPAVRAANKWWLRADHVRIAANVRAPDGPEMVAVALNGISLGAALSTSQNP